MPYFNPKNDASWDLPATQIDIWRFPLTGETNWISVLNEQERERAHRFYFKRHARRFIQAHGIMREILANYLNQHPADVLLTTDANGKPCLKGSDLCFNLSHSNEYALLAVGRQYALGVDLEVFTSRSYQGVAEHMFSPEECKKLKTAPEELACAIFFSIWSQKEALIKACGLGLRYPTKDFSVQALAPNTYEVYDSLHEQHWAMYPFFPLPGYAGALCYHQSCNTLRFFSY
tara:strand:+ start:353 stop:1048 length:696 start_codon:yes stop_codon:yes gene_type:complete